MNGNAHIVFGVVCAGVAQVMFDVLPYQPLPLLYGAGCVVIGALLPDIDHPNATASRVVGIGRGQGPLGCSGYLGGIARAALGGHRGLTHTALAVAGLYWLATQLPTDYTPYATLALIGYGSHLFGDMLTEQGIPLLWPFGRRQR